MSCGTHWPTTWCSWLVLCGNDERACELFQFFDTVVVGGLVEDLYLEKGSNHPDAIANLLRPLEDCRTNASRMQRIEQSKSLVESRMPALVSDRLALKDIVRFPWP